MQENNISLNNFEQCVKCAICTDFCPVMKVLPAYPGPKKAGPDGERLRMMDAAFFDANLKYCLNCKRCEQACPSGVRIADIIHSAREKYAHPHPSLRDAMLASTDFMGSVASPLAPVVNATLGLGATKAVLDGVMKIDSHRTLPKYSARKFTSWFKKEAAPLQDKFPRQVSYFHGCYVNYNYPQLGKDFVRLLNALGYGVQLLDKEKCCGVAMISAGMFDAARKNAAVNVASIGDAASQGRKVLATSSTCVLTMKDEYPGILGVDNSAIGDALSFAARFVFEEIESGRAKVAFKEGWRARAAYHVPCHMERLGWGIFTRRLMEMIPGMDLIMLDSNCCGISGTYGFKKENFERSQQIGAPLFDNIVKVAPEFVVCECETCKWQIEMSTGYKVKNPVSVFLDAIDIEATAALNVSLN